MSPVNIINPGELAVILDMLEQQQEQLLKKSVFTGFDGFVDTVTKLIREKKTDHPDLAFGKLREFGDYITAKDGSFSLETGPQIRKAGGNMPLLANALGRLGTRVNCVGAFGYPTAHPIFEGLHHNCSRYSFAEPGTCVSYEFNDGKMMVAEMADLNNSGWQRVKEIVGLQKIQALFARSSLACFVNWSEIDSSSEIWRGFTDEVLWQDERKEQPWFFFDLSDCSKRSKEEIETALHLIERIGTRTNTTLGLNRNEANTIMRKLTGASGSKDATLLARELSLICKSRQLLVHDAYESIAIEQGQTYRCQSFHQQQPVATTGAGDHFNAGYGMGLLLELDPASCLLLGNAVAGYFVGTGKSPSVTELKSYTKDYIHS